LKYSVYFIVLNLFIVVGCVLTNKMSMWCDVTWDSP